MRNKRPKFVKERPPDPKSVGTDWRLFLALPMPVAAMALVDEIVAALAGDDWPVRWVAPETAHLTLHFLGDTPPERAELLRLALGQTVGRHEAFALRTDGLGVFPDERRPRVIWLGLQGETRRLTSLFSELGATLKAMDFPVEEKPLRPHVTLGRVRDEAPSSFPSAVQRRLADPELRRLIAAGETDVPVREVLLVRSILERGGARHTPIARYPLRGDA